jgi:predicted nucleotidyltransferase
MLSSLGKNIIKTLAYYDIFSYPLKAEEIFYNLSVNHCTSDDIKTELKNLCNKNLLFRIDEFYLLQNNEQFVKRRIEGNKLCSKRLKSAFRMSRFIAGFPFVRAVFLSGSISKGFMEKDSDIDYFIITQPGRLWIAKLFLTVFKKIFLLNSRKLFCINYYIDSDHLEIDVKNIFTAIEIASLIPVYGKKYYDEFYEKNCWIKDYFPNYPKRNNRMIDKTKSGYLKKFIEKIFDNRFGDRLDDFSMKIFSETIKRKFNYFNKNDFNLAFRTTKYESKYHPKFFQKKVLISYDEKVNHIQRDLKISLM